MNNLKVQETMVLFPLICFKREYKGKGKTIAEINIQRQLKLVSWYCISFTYGVFIGIEY